MIIKIGGGSAINITGIMENLARLKEPTIIIHGANSIRDDLAKSLNKPKKILTSIKGYSSVFSDKEAIDLIFMSYAGLANKRIVETCHQFGINAVGLTGMDGKLIRGKRNSGIKVIENNKRKIKRDYSGKPEMIDKEFLNLLLKNGYTPVITIPIIDEFNHAINSENDDIVALFQETFRADKIIFLIESPGLLKDSSQEDTLIKIIDLKELQKIEQSSSGRIKRKYHALNKISKLGPVKIIISDGRVDNPILNALQENGTIINSL